MQKSMITAAIALTLVGCGGGESGNNNAQPVKQYTISFLGLKNQSNEKDCQIFGYDAAQNTQIIAFASRPDSGYEIIIHYSNGGVHKKYNNFSTTSFSFNQNEVPPGGYVSFAEFNRFGINHVTTFSKELLPDAFSIYANGSETQACLRGSNPQQTQAQGYINLLDFTPSYRGFNFVNQPLKSLTTQYISAAQSNAAIEITAQQKSLLAVLYAGDLQNEEIQELKGFKFTPFTEIGSRDTPLELIPVTRTDAPWHKPTNLNLELAALFVNGKQFNAPSAYLWQPLIIDQDGHFSYSNEIDDDNYYLYLQGQEIAQGQIESWQVQHVAQGTENRGARLDAEGVLGILPQPNAPILANCTTETNRQCLTINTGSLSANQGLQRVVLDAELKQHARQFIRQVFYTPIQTTLPILSFNRDNVDEGLNANTAKTFISFIVSESPEVREAFLYQHQNLQPGNENPSDFKVDFVPLLKNIAAQQNFQDKLKRHPYTWVWLKTDNN